MSFLSFCADTHLGTDESAMAARKLHRPRARAPRGERTKRIPKPLTSRRFSLLPAISLSGYLGLVVQEGAIRRDDMEDFLSNHVVRLDSIIPISVYKTKLVFFVSATHDEPIPS